MTQQNRENQPNKGGGPDSRIDHPRRDHACSTSSAPKLEPTETDLLDSTSSIPTRRSLLSGFAALAAGSLTIESASATTTPRQTGEASNRNVPTPTVEGPIEGGEVTGEPQTASIPDLSAHGYTEEEYFVSGEARALGPPDPYPVEEREDPPDETAEYKTRILIYRPTNRQDFNGGVIAGWPNVTTQRDVPVMWINMYNHIMREGYVFVTISAQKVGVDNSEVDQDLKTWDPERYGELHHPGDSYSYDIYSQAIQALRVRPRPNQDLLCPLNPDRVLAAGMSQSAQYLRFYVNEIQEDHQLIDGFMPVVTSESPQDQDDIRDDVVPVMWLISEDEADAERRSDSGLFKLWAVAGASHVNHWWSEYVEALVRRDHEGKDPEWNEEAVGQYGAQDDGMYGVCAPGYDDITVLASFNYFPMRYAYSAALKQLDDWVMKGEEPPSAPRFEREDGELQHDQYGNILGGLRLPPIEVPVAFYDAIPCFITGRTYQLGDATLQQLYPTHEEYVAQMQEATDEAVDNGYLLPADAEDLMSRVRDSPISRD